VSASRLASSTDPSSLDFRPLNGVLVEVAGPLAVSSTEIPALQSSNTCSSGSRYLDGFEVAAGAHNLFVTFFFGDNVSACLAGGCRTCDIGPITTSHGLDFVRGVARAHKGQTDAVVVVSPVDEIDFPRAGSIRSILASHTPEGTTVSVQNAVVVGYNSVSATKGSLFLQDAGGGRWSGIQLFCTAAACNDAAKALLPGEMVDVSGKLVWYLGNTPEIDSTEAPLKVGASKALTTSLSAGEVGMTAAASGGVFAPYNQVYVKVSGTLSVASVTPNDLLTTCTGTTDTSYEGFQMSDGAHDYLVADLFAPTYTLCVSDRCAPCASPVTGGAAFSSVSGVARVGRGSRVQIAPTGDLDVVAAQ
jgi:hypothetical protein